MKSLVLNKYRSIPELIKINYPNTSISHPFIIKNNYSPINPSDLGMINGVYGTKEFLNKQFPFTLGFEGSGTIVDIDKSIKFNEELDLKEYIGKCVSFYSLNGAWSEYVVVNSKNMLFLENNNTTDQDYMEGSMMFINPLTAISFINIIKERQKSKSDKVKVGITSYNSSLGKIFKKLCDHYNIDNVSIVRNILENNKDQNDSLLSLQDPNFKQKFSDKKVNILFDCFGGDTVGMLINLISNNSEVYHFGNSSMKNLSGISTQDVLFRNVSIKGFHLLHYFEENLINRKNVFNEFSKLYNSDKRNLLKSNVEKVFKIDNYKEALDHYKDKMSKRELSGKILLDFRI